MLNEAKTSRPRPRPELWGQGRGRGQFLEVEAKRRRRKIKLWIKSIKWWLATNMWIYIIMIKTTQFNFSFSRTVTIFYHSVMSCSRRSKVQTDWSVDLFLAAGSPAADWGQAEAKCLRPRPRPRPKFCPRGHFGLEDLTSLVLWSVLISRADVQFSDS